MHAAIADTGCTSHFFTIDAPYQNTRNAPAAITIQNPNGTTMHSDTIADIVLPNMPPDFPSTALQVYVVPDLHTKSLLSLGQLCDAGCTITLTSTTLEVLYHGTCILQGTRTPLTRLWHVAIGDQPDSTAPPPSPTHSAYLAAGGATPAHLVAFHHASLGAPALSTLEKALRLNYITGFPGLTVDTLRRHPPRHSIPMLKGHLDQTRKNQRSTQISGSATIIPYDEEEIQRPSTAAVDHEEHDDAFPTAEPLNARTHFCYATTVQASGQIHTDLTGKFIAESSTGNNYLFVLYDYDSNAILCEPIKNRTKHSILAAFQNLHGQLVKAGVRPQLQRLDNECSDILKEFMTNEGIDYQLVPPHVHRRNAAERAIRTLKKHFVATLCSTDPAFPLYLWDRLLPQAMLSLNLMRGSRMNTKLSAYVQLFGVYDYNRTPIAPPGTRAIIHDKPANRETWAAHGLDGWYIGPAMESYRCYTCWINETRRERICDTVAFLPMHVALPVATPNDMILASLKDIAQALKHPTLAATMVPPIITNQNRTALIQLQTLLDPETPRPDDVHSPPLSLRQPEPTTVPPASSLRVVNDPLDPIEIPTTPRRGNLSHTTEHTTAMTPDKVPNLIDDDVLPAIPELPIPLPVTPPNEDPTETAPLTEATFQSLTGPKARKQRRATRRAPTAPRRNHHRTRTSTGTPRRQPQHLAAHAAATATTFYPDEFALHGNAFNPDTGKIAEYKELSLCSDGPHWIESNCEEIGRLFQGYKKIPGTNTCVFIRKADIPKHKRATYLRIVAAHRPEKENAFRVRWTCGGNLIVYEFDASTKTADLPTVKCHLNSVLSTRNARFMTLDLKDFFLGTPLVDFEYMRIPRHCIPDVIMDLYNLWDMVEPDGYIYVRIERGMYGLPHAGRIANDALIAFLAPHGYHPCELTPGLWKHDHSDVTFTLVVDDFGVRYTDRAVVEEFLTILKQKYELKADWQGTRYCGLTLEWDYANRLLDVSMPGYVERALQRFSHARDDSQPSNSPHKYQIPSYGKKIQYADTPDTSPVLDSKAKTRIQEIIGVFLYYARAVDNTMLPALGTLATQQAAPTQHTMNAVIQFLNYAVANPDAVLRYHASDMVLHVESDASYLSETKARSRYAGYQYLSTRPSESPQTDPIPPFNAAVNVPCQILREVVSSAAEAELAGLFHNAKEACPIRICLEEMGHPQPATPIVTDNSTAAGIANDTIKQKRSKAIDMRFYWVRDRVKQKQFHILWRKGALNKADYFTKHHPAKHHQAMRSTYLHQSGTTQNYFDCLTDFDDDLPSANFSQDTAIAKPSPEKSCTCAQTGANTAKIDPTISLDSELTRVDIKLPIPSSKSPIHCEGVLKSVPGCSYLSRLTGLLTLDGRAHNFV